MKNTLLTLNWHTATPEQLDDLIKKGAHVNGENDKKQSPVYLAINAQNVKCVLFLCQKGAQLNRCHHGVAAPVKLAVLLNNLPLVVILKQFGANLKILDSKGNSLLHSASKRGFVKMAQFLYKNGANPLAENKKGITPYDMAKDNHQSHLVLFFNPLLKNHQRTKYRPFKKITHKTGALTPCYQRVKR